MSLPGEKSGTGHSGESGEPVFLVSFQKTGIESKLLKLMDFSVNLILKLSQNWPVVEPATSAFVVPANCAGLRVRYQPLVASLERGYEYEKGMKEGLVD